jgi:hypothetical protein
MCNNIDFDKMDIQGDLKDQMNMHYFAVVNIVICGCEFESRPGDTSLWDKVCQRLAAGFIWVRRFPPPIKVTATR